MQNLWKQVADQYCTSAEKVQAEIAEAIRAGHEQSGRGRAAGVGRNPRQQDEPQPEDVVAWIAAQLLAAESCRNLQLYRNQPEMAVKR
ncbi:MAG: hypothetical protein ACLR1R_09655 [Ruminococcus callidus]